MKNIMKIGSGIQVMPLALQLKMNPQLWNQRNARTKNDTSPQREVSDIWVRHIEGVEPDSEFDSIWLEPHKLLTAVQSIAFGVMGLVQGERLGGVLITRIPPGKQVYPHVDLSWHAKYYDKFAVQIESHQQQAFCYEDGKFVSAPGDIYWFNNQAEHWVINESPVDRITLILCIKTDFRKA
jgi:hypothetical protein